jgi:peptidoglycan/LPS O-acetylase OafA/YrhL
MCVITASLASPSVGHRDWVIDIILVLIVFPLCIFSAAHGTVRHGAKLLSVLGAASYPVYLFHLPAARLFKHAMHHLEDRYVPMSGLVLAALIIAVAVIGERVYDLPVRRWLKSRYIHNQS